jgi:hypothetical protein
LVPSVVVLLVPSVVVWSVVVWEPLPGLPVERASVARQVSLWELWVEVSLRADWEQSGVVSWSEPKAQPWELDWARWPVESAASWWGERAA